MNEDEKRIMRWIVRTSFYKYKSNALLIAATRSQIPERLQDDINTVFFKYIDKYFFKNENGIWQPTELALKECLEEDDKEFWNLDSWNEN